MCNSAIHAILCGRDFSDKIKLIRIISGKNLYMSEKLCTFALEIVNYSCYE